MIKKIYALLPPKEQKRCFWVITSVFLRSVLDFAGVAALVPVIFLLADRLDGDRDVILLLCACVILFVCLKNLIIMLLARFQINFQLNNYRCLSRKMFINYYRRGLMFLKKKGSVHLAYEVNGVVFTFTQGVLSSLLLIMGEGILILLIALALIIWKPLLGFLTCLIFVPVSLFYGLTIRKKVRRLGEQSLKAQRAQSRNVIETFRGYAELEISDAFPTSLAAFNSNLNTIIKNRKSMDFYRLFPSFMSELAFAAGLMLLVAFGGSDLLLTGGVFAVAAFRIIPAVKSMLHNWAMFQNDSFSVNIIAQGTEDVQIDEIIHRPKGLKGSSIEARNLSFAFDDGHQLLKNISFKINCGETVGIKGKSGSGKSTLFNILLGFYPPTGGKVMIDGQTLDKETIKDWHRITGYVPQEIFIVNGSLAENIALGQKEIDREKVKRILERVKLSEWAESLENGLDTELGEFGNRLSGGQKQRIGIARALYKDAKVLFFDEATSSLDGETEQEINMALSELSSSSENLTLIIIAHRESSLAFCDRIMDLDKGVF